MCHIRVDFSKIVVLSNNKMNSNNFTSVSANGPTEAQIRCIICRIVYGIFHLVRLGNQLAAQLNTSLAKLKYHVKPVKARVN